MRTDREIDEILTEIGREHRQIGAPEKLESVLRTAAGGKKNSFGIPGLKVAWSWAAAMIFLIAVAIAGVIWQTRRSHPSQNQQVRSVPAPQVKPEPMLPSARFTGQQSVQSQSVRSQPVQGRRPRIDRAEGSIGSGFTWGAGTDRTC